MAGHQRPLFVLFGASFTEYSFQPGGWGASLVDYYSRKADILLRGYKGWNTRRAVAVLETFFPKCINFKLSSSALQQVVAEQK